MDTPLPSNETLLEFSSAIPWQKIEEQTKGFRISSWLSIDIDDLEGLKITEKFLD